MFMALQDAEGRENRFMGMGDRQPQTGITCPNLTEQQQGGWGRV